LNITDSSSNPKHSQNIANKESLNGVKVLKEDMLFKETLRRYLFRRKFTALTGKKSLSSFTVSNTEFGRKSSTDKEGKTNNHSNPQPALHFHFHALSCFN